jgi:Fe-S cluster assembly iron-binding protein IscA
MIGITERAKEALLKLKRSAPIDNPEVCIRLASGEEGRLELFPDTYRAGDQVVEHQGAKLLLVDHKLFDALAGVTIDCQPTGEGLQLVAEASAPGNGPGPE